MKNQGTTTIFNDEYCGTQCTAMCAFAIATHFSNSIKKWSTETMNQVLINGDIYFKECQQRLKLNLHPFRKYLEVEEVLGQIEINGQQLFIQYFNNDLISATRNAELNNVNLLNHINEFLNLHCDHILIVINDYTYAVFKQNNDLLLFDSHSKTPTGRRTESANGKASVMLFKAPQAAIQLNKYLIKLNGYDSNPKKTKNNRTSIYGIYYL